MGNVNYLIATGLTNRYSEDWGTLASAGTPHKTFALCCGLAHTNTFKDNCNRCGSALFWRRELMPLAESMIENYFSRNGIQAKEESVDQSTNLGVSLGTIARWGNYGPKNTQSA